MDIINRVKNICLAPNSEWPVIAEESTTTGELITGYVAPLAAIGAVAGFIGGSLVGHSLPFVGFYRVPIMAGLGAAAFTFVMAIVGVFVVAFVIDALAPSFGGEKNSAQALKVAVYSYTPAWVAGVLQIVPALGILGVLAGLYGLYLLYLGLPRLMKCPQDKAVGYTVIVVVCAIVLSIIITAVGGMVVGAGVTGAGALGGTMRGSGADSEVQFDPDSPLGRLQDLGSQMEEVGQKMEEAEQRGDQAGQMAAAAEAFGTLFGGGRRVEPLAVDQLKSFVPATFAGLPMKSSSAERTGMAGLMVSEAEATYGDDGGKRVTLQITDTGGVSGLAGLASWAGMEGEREDDNSVERTRNVDGRFVHEKASKSDGTNVFDVLLGQRFVVSAEGSGVSLNDLQAGVSAIDLSRLESMKDVGVEH